MLMGTNKNNITWCMIVVLLLMVSCDKKRVFDEYEAIPDQRWHKSNQLAFQFAVQDTLQKHQMFVNLRNNKDYPFSNLFLITEMTFPDGTIVTDTLEYDMTDVTGKFLGQGFSDVKENKLLYKENITFPVKGAYTFKIRQSMRKNTEVSGIEVLEGVTHVGFRIEKTRK